MVQVLLSTCSSLAPLPFVLLRTCVFFEVVSLTKMTPNVSAVVEKSCSSLIINKSSPMNKHLAEVYID